MTGSVEMRVDTEVAPEACNSSPGNANLRIGTQAGHDEGSHSNPLRKYALRHTPSVIPVHAGVTSTPRRYPCTRRRHVHPRASSLYTPPSRPPPASFLRRQES